MSKQKQTQTMIFWNDDYKLTLVMEPLEVPPVDPPVDPQPIEIEIPTGIQLRVISAQIIAIPTGITLKHL